MKLTPQTQDVEVVHPTTTGTRDLWLDRPLPNFSDEIVLPPVQHVQPLAVTVNAVAKMKLYVTVREKAAKRLVETPVRSSLSKN